MTSFKDALKKVSEGSELSEEEMYDAMQEVMHGNATEVGALRGKLWGGGHRHTCMGMPWK